MKSIIETAWKVVQALFMVSAIVVAFAAPVVAAAFVLWELKEWIEKLCGV